LKRPAAAAAPPAKRGKKSAAEKELQAKVNTVSEAIMLHEGLPESALKTLCVGLGPSLTTMKAERHAIQTKVVEMIAEALAGVEMQFTKKIETYQEQVDGADASKATLDKEEQDAAEEFEKLKAATAAADEAAAADAKLVKEAEAALAESKAAQAAGDAQITATEAGKAKLDSLVSDLIAKSKESAIIGRDGKKLIKMMYSVGKEFSFDLSMLESAEGVVTKSPEERGTFDKIVEKQLEDTVAAKTTELVAELEKLMPAKLERAHVVEGKEVECNAAKEKAAASKAALEAAKAAEADGAKALDEKKKKVKNFLPEMKKITTALETAKADLEAFKTGALATFNDLKELAPPPPEPEPVPVPEEPKADVPPATEEPPTEPAAAEEPKAMETEAAGEAPAAA